MTDWSGPKYIGKIENGWFEGEGCLTYDNGTIYEGEFSKGKFHGKGAMIFPGKGRLEGEWFEGKATTGKFYFEDGLAYERSSWRYLSDSDHRLYSEIQNPDCTVPRSYPAIPRQTFDTGSGYYDPSVGITYSYDGEHVIDRPSQDEAIWILENCRQGL